MKEFLSAVFIVACAFFISMMGPYLDDHSAENDAAKDALIQQRQQQRFEKAAQDICGPNSAYRLTDNDKEIICVSKNGKLTHKVTM